MEHATIFYVQATIFYILMYCFNNLKKKSKFEFRNKQVHWCFFFNVWIYSIFHLFIIIIPHEKLASFWCKVVEIVHATIFLRKLRMFYTQATYVLQPNQHVLATNALHIFRTEIAHGINSHSSNIMGFICYSKSANEHHYCTEVHRYIFWWRKALTKSQNLCPGVIREGVGNIFFI